MFRLAVVMGVVVALITITGGAYWKGRLSADEEWQLKWTQAVLEAETSARQKEAQLQAEVDLARKSLLEATDEIARKDAAIRSLRNSTAGLRERLANYAADSDTLATCREKLRALGEITARGGELLSEGQELVQRFATAHDRRASEAKALIEGWPK